MTPHTQRYTQCLRDKRFVSRTYLGEKIVTVRLHVHVDRNWNRAKE